ncbi:TniQ family protein [Duganella sp. HH105]|uniref:TniQ family protein n=1 Tax=Duganella sp. HH105 TaxID=1781067 RepID=UPI0008933953|nr:TniQ family protein [Duganella sp. HH105]OEZ61266.1 hypothetical protein DUGA6_22920 [Duganella sp. HH105]
MIHIPYIPIAYPDEILGSWLARISFHNGKKTWSEVLLACGFTDNPKPLFDLVDYDEKLGKFLYTLGTSYERIIQELTTLPYWLTFSANNDGDILPGTAKMKMPLGLRSRKVTCIGVLGLKRVQGEATSPAFCLSCLSDDKKQHGEAYWHRAHQLPNVYFCHIHGCELHDGCPKCGKRALAPARGLVPLPREVCDCGCRFDAIELRGKPNATHMAFAKLSAEALNVTNVIWGRAEVIFQLKQWFKKQKQHKNFISLLSAEFGSVADPLNEKNELTVSTLVKVGGRKLCFRSTPDGGSSPEYCAILAALGVNLSTAINAFKEAIHRPPAKPRNKMPRKVWIEDAEPKKPNFERDRIHLERVTKLTMVFQEMIFSSERPQMIHAQKLGHTVGLSHTQTFQVLSTNDYLKESIRIANSELPQRRLKWAISILRSEGKDLSKSSVWARAGMGEKWANGQQLIKLRALWNSFNVEGGKLVWLKPGETLPIS